jgi:tRNA 2-thiouridine synthesizing protein E
MEIDRKNIKLDENGHLANYLCWNENIAQWLSEKDEFILKDGHWQIINLVRKIYLETKTSPPMRLLIKAINIQVSEEKANSRYLYQLFPNGPVRLACKYAGLPKPKHCM